MLIDKSLARGIGPQMFTMVSGIQCQYILRPFWRTSTQSLAEDAVAALATRRNMGTEEEQEIGRRQLQRNWEGGGWQSERESELTWGRAGSHGRRCGTCRAGARRPPPSRAASSRASPWWSGSAAPPRRAVKTMPQQQKIVWPPPQAQSCGNDGMTLYPSVRAAPARRAVKTEPQQRRAAWTQTAKSATVRGVAARSGEAAPGRERQSAVYTMPQPHTPAGARAGRRVPSHWCRNDGAMPMPKE